MAKLNDHILELLKDDKEYYSGIGKKFLSNSDIGTLLNNPKDFGKSREDNKSFAEGRYFHQLILQLCISIWIHQELAPEMLPKSFLHHRMV